MKFIFRIVCTFILKNAMIEIGDKNLNEIAKNKSDNVSQKNQRMRIPLYPTSWLSPQNRNFLAMAEQLVLFIGRYWIAVSIAALLSVVVVCSIIKLASPLVSASEISKLMITSVAGWAGKGQWEKRKASKTSKSDALPLP